MTKKAPPIPSGILELQKQILELQRSAFTSSFNALSDLQERQEALIESVAREAPGVPEEAKQAIDAWIDVVRRSRAQYLEAAQKGFDLYGQLVDRYSSSPDDDSSDDDSSDNDSSDQGSSE